MDKIENIELFNDRIEFRKLTLFISNSCCECISKQIFSKFKNLNKNVFYLDLFNINDNSIFDLFLNNIQFIDIDLINFWLDHIYHLSIRVDTNNFNKKIQIYYFDENIETLFKNKNWFCLYTYKSAIIIVKIVLFCFLLKKQNIGIIQNPEICLYPSIVSKLSDLFAVISNNDSYLIIETQNEHIVSNLRYNIYKKKCDFENIIIYYKNNDSCKFDKIFVNKNGRFLNKQGEICSFPKGFFDIDIHKLLEIG